MTEVEQAEAFVSEKLHDKVDARIELSRATIALEKAREEHEEVLQRTLTN